MVLQAINNSSDSKSKMDSMNKNNKSINKITVALVVLTAQGMFCYPHVISKFGFQGRREIWWGLVR